MNRYQVAVMHSSLFNSYEFYFGKRKPMDLQKRMTLNETTTILSSLPFRTFHNALRILYSLDYHEVSFLKDAEWFTFRGNPYTFFISTSDTNAAHIWEAIQRRQPTELKNV